MGKIEYYEFLKSHGYSLEKIGCNETALSREHALEAIEILREHEIPILGGDVYLLHDDHIEFTYSMWTCDRSDVKTNKEFVENSYSKAKNYILKFPESKTGIIIFTIVV